MRTIINLICKEFEQWGYSLKKTIEGSLLYASNIGYDYWIVCSNIDILKDQKHLYDQISKYIKEFDFIEKNITLLLLSDIDSNLKTVDAIKIENNKSYFKKYVLQYSSDSVEELYRYIEDNGVDSIANLILSEQYFNQIKNDSQSLSGVSLLYTIAHKLPFVPIFVEPKERSVVDFKFSSKELNELFDWVNHAPSNERELDNYLNTLINEE